MKKHDYKAVALQMDSVLTYEDAYHLLKYRGQAIRHALLLADKGGWQPIETAPDKFIGLDWDGYAKEMRISTDNERKDDRMSDYVIAHDSNWAAPTHWMPLPDAPAMIQQAEQEIG